jgi:hypothetical protein
MRQDSCNVLDFTINRDRSLAPNLQYRWLDEYPLKGKAANAIRIYYVP